ncbi:MAG: hypothetical protein PHN88_05140 [Ignavibacteria bacterium]|nr:hypothetical protein [Ignavibacteria bacterium]
MKTRFLFLLAVIIIAFSSQTYAQFDKFSFQIGAGIVNPDKGMRGSNYINYSNTYRYVNQVFGIDSTFVFPWQVALVDSSLMNRNYGAKTGFFIQGMGKINLDKYETVRLIGTIGYSAFNAFEGSKSGFVPEFTQSYIQQKSISYDYSLSNFGLGLGVEVAPLSFTKVVSPFVNGTFNFNFLNAKLTRTTGPSDSMSINFSDFRMGISLGVGIEFKVNPQWGLVVGAKYDFANLLLKNTDRASGVYWGRTNAGFNDEEGNVQANIYDPLGTPIRNNIHVSQKDMNWSTFYVAVNFYPNFGGTTKKK